MVPFKLCDFFYHVVQHGGNFKAVGMRIRTKQVVTNHFVAFKGLVCAVAVVVLFASFEKTVQSVGLMVAIIGSVDGKKLFACSRAKDTAFDRGSDGRCHRRCIGRRGGRGY